MVSKTELYNDALLILGQRKLASIAEGNTARRALDDAYDRAVCYCLEQGFWNHAMRSVQADSSASVVPTFGWDFAFAKPSDWVRTLAVSAYESMEPPLLQFVDEPNYWYTNVDPLYIRYVSDDTAYGLDLSIWPETFANYVSNRLAVKTCKLITGGAADDAMLLAEKRAKADALSKDAMNEPPGFPPTGSWIRSRTAWQRGSLTSTTR